MLFRKKQEPESKTDLTPQERNAPFPLQAHRYSIRFDIFPKITYLDDRLCGLLVDFLPLFRGFPEEVWMSKKLVEEGLDFCQISFWVFAREPDAIKAFSIWFQGIFREEGVSFVLERFVQYALESAEEVEVVLADWSRAHVPDEEARAIARQEMERQEKREA